MKLEQRVMIASEEAPNDLRPIFESRETTALLCTLVVFEDVQIRRATQMPRIKRLDIDGARGFTEGCVVERSQLACMHDARRH